MYTQSLTLKDEFKQYMYEKMLKIYGVSEEEMFFAIEAISFFNTFAIFDRMTLIFANKDMFEHNDSNMLEYLKKMKNKENHYDPTAMNRSQNPEYGMSHQHED